MPIDLAPHVLPADPTSALHAATKSYVDAAGLGPDGLTAGDETMSRGLVFANNLTTASGSMRITYFTARKTETTTQVRTFSGSTAAGATPTLCRVGLYLVDASDNGTSLVASIASDTALWATGSTAYTRSWSSSYAKIAGQRYALAQLIVTGAATPTWPGPTVLAAGIQTDINATPRLCGTLASQTDLPASFTAAALTSSVNRYYGVVLP